MPTRHRTSLCREGWYLLLLLAVVLTWALLRENNLLLLVAGLMCGALLVNWRLSAAALRRVEVRRCVVSGAHAGSWMTIEVEVANGHRRLGCWAVSVEDCLERKDGRGDEQTVRPTLMFPCVSAGRCVRQSLSRASAAAGPLCTGATAPVSTPFPFGLFQRTLWLAGDDQLVVLPRLGRLRPAWVQHYQPTPHGTHGAQAAGVCAGRFLRGAGMADRRQCPLGALAEQRPAPGVGDTQFEQPGERNWRSCSICGNRTSRSRTSGSASNLPSASPPRSWRISAAAAGASCCWRRPRRLRPVCLANPASVAMSRDALEVLAVAQASPAGELWRCGTRC